MGWRFDDTSTRSSGGEAPEHPDPLEGAFDMLLRSITCLLLLPVLTVAAGSARSTRCDEARVYSKDLDQAELDFLLAFLPARPETRCDHRARDR